MLAVEDCSGTDGVLIIWLLSVNVILNLSNYIINLHYYLFVLLFNKTIFAEKDDLSLQQLSSLQCVSMNNCISTSRLASTESFLSYMVVNISCVRYVRDITTRGRCGGSSVFVIRVSHLPLDTEENYHKKNFVDFAAKMLQLSKQQYWLN